MESWEVALYEFLREWENRDDVVGALVCGSYITGNPSSHSDIDLHIILADGTAWRERGNRIVNGFLIEYFANSPQQIVCCFREDINDNSRDAATQFATGKVYLDKDGTVAGLKTEAMQWLSKPFPPMNADAIELAKYMLWDNLDNLQDVCNLAAPDCVFIYQHTLCCIYKTYARYLQQPIIHFSKQMKCLSQPEEARRKYLMEPFPDQCFVAMLSSAVTETSVGEMVRRSEQLTYHVLEALGGFDVDGWRFRSSSSCQENL